MDGVRNKIEKPIGDIFYGDVSSLVDLRLYYCEISDLTGLACLNNLKELGLGHNSLSDISPLLSNIDLHSPNAGPDDRDVVDIRNNPLDCDDPVTLEHIETLEERSVRLFHDCE